MDPIWSTESGFLTAKMTKINYKYVSFAQFNEKKWQNVNKIHESHIKVLCNKFNLNYNKLRQMALKTLPQRNHKQVNVTGYPYYNKNNNNNLNPNSIYNERKHG